MSSSRRSFLKNSAVVAAVAGSPLALGRLAYGQSTRRAPGSQAPLANIPVDDISRTSRQSFEQFVHTEFSFSGRGFGRLTLSEVKDLEDPKDSSYTPTGTRESFRLLFKGSRERLADGTYTVEHAALGRFEMYISDAGSAKNIRLYQAQFNRL